MTVAIARLAYLLWVVILAASIAADAQPTGKVHRIGVLGSGSPTSAAQFVEAFNQALRELGWVEGKNIVIDYRFAEGRFDRLPDLAAELVRLKVDVIAASPTPSALAAKNATRTIPIVMVSAAEPVQLGLIASLARPGGNVTGLSWSVNVEIIAKGLELLKEAVPRVRRVAVLSNPANPGHAVALKDVKAAAQSLGLQLQLLEVRGPGEFDGAFVAMVAQHADALLVVADSLFNLYRVRLAELATRYHLPSMHGLRENVEAGGLMSYGPNITASFRRAAFYVDKILNGTKPTDLPVEQPTRFELVINVGTAKALGLEMPRSLLTRADQIIE